MEGVKTATKDTARQLMKFKDKQWVKEQHYIKVIFSKSDCCVVIM